jgi:hypothetical protein
VNTLKVGIVQKLPLDASRMQNFAWAGGWLFSERNCRASSGELQHRALTAGEPIAENRLPSAEGFIAVVFFGQKFDS